MRNLSIRVCLLAVLAASPAAVFAQATAPAATSSPEAAVASLYAAVSVRPGEKHVQGVNSLQLAEIDGAWRIVDILWETTRTGGELPRDLTR